ncbi:MAG TPA: ATP-binding protein [Longimicrobiales bacterium]|nr:ATP-binding protein [Longimicrobiales bacterium]
MRWTIGRYADLIPPLTFLVGMGGVFLIDQERRKRVTADDQQAASIAERRAGALADALGNEVSARIGSLAAAELQFTSVEDSVSQQVLLSALDTVTRRSGLMAISVIFAGTGQALARSGSILASRVTEQQDSAIRLPYLRALATRAPTASGVIDAQLGRRVLLFRPVERGDSVPGVLIAEIDPHLIYRNSYDMARMDTVPQGFQHTLYGPNGVHITAAQAKPPGWRSVSRPVRVADTEWTVVTAYPPPNPRIYRAERIAIWVTGTALSLAIAMILLFLRRTIATQKEEIARRQVAEEAARTAAAEARERAREARDLAAQLEAAQRASQRLSTSLDPDDVVELFLGGVAEILDADVASLYTFEEEGELVVGRKRMVLREVEGVTDRFRREDIAQIRAPIAMLPHLAEPVATGEPYVRSGRPDARGPVVSGGAEPDALIAVPLMIAGHTVGVATWESYSGQASFAHAATAFAQALAAPAAAALRTAELFTSLEAERLHASREALRFAAVLDQMADGVVVVDPQGRVERSNTAADELLGDELGSTPIEQWPARYDLATVEGRGMTGAEFPLIRALRGERVRRANFIVKNPWGTERHLSSSAGPILTAAGEPTGAAMVLRDVSDEHQYAEMLRHTNRELRRQAEMLEEVNQQLREATKAKDQFVAVMSHELRTPINAIMGYSDLLDLGVKGPLNDDQRAMLARVRDTSRHLLGLINEVLDLAKIGAGRMDLEITEQSVRAVVERAAQQIMPMAAGKGLELVVSADQTGADSTVLADETRLTQIVINLLSNAVKFTPSGTVSIRYGRRGANVEIAVRDTGPGISPEQQERIFEEFYQVEGGLARSTGGTGLGLAIARRFARLMGGDITVRSTPDEGAEFLVELPAASDRPGADSAARDAVVALVPDAETLERIRQDLAGSVRVLGTAEPRRIAALVRESGAGAVALDARSPGGGAWEALAALQHEPDAAGVRTLLFAGVDDYAESALELGLFVTLEKGMLRERTAALIRGLTNLEGPVSLVLAADDAEVRRAVEDALGSGGHRVQTLADGAALLEAVAAERPDVIMVDLLAGSLTAVDVMARLRADAALRDVPVIVLLDGHLAPGAVERLAESVATLTHERRARVDAIAELIRSAARVAGAVGTPA